MGLTSPHLLDEATENDEVILTDDECTEVIQGQLYRPLGAYYNPITRQRHYQERY